MSKLKSYILFQACDLIQYERNILDKEERIRDNEMLHYKRVYSTRERVTFDLQLQLQQLGHHIWPQLLLLQLCYPLES